MLNNVKREVNENQRLRRFLTEVPPEYVFRCYDGKVLRSMKELYDAFSAMTDETYSYHWNNEKKDFSNWVRYTIGDMKLAEDLEGATSRNLAAWEVAIRIAYIIRHIPRFGGIKE